MDSAAPLSNALILGAALAVAFGLWAWVRRWLTMPAAALAAVIGTVIFATGKTLALALLFFFFSTRLFELLARLRADAARPAAQQNTTRTLEQVAAVGAVPAACAAGQLVTGNSAWGVAALAAIAFATADNWATAIGMTSPKPPRLLGFGRPVQPGLSGGVTLRGTLAALLGALSIGLFAIGKAGAGEYAPLLWILGLGVGGAFLDSVLGAVAQQKYRCTICRAETESPAHCGGPAARQGGWLTNPGVNFVCSLSVALLAWWTGQ